MKNQLAIIICGIFGLMLTNATAQVTQRFEFGEGASLEVPAGWKSVDKMPEGLVFIASSADGNMTTNVQEEQKADYEEVADLAEFYQISVDHYTAEVWADLDPSAGKEGEINGAKAVFGTISPTLDLPNDTKLATKGFLMVFENATHYYTGTILSSVSRYDANNRALLNILKSFKAP